MADELNENVMIFEITVSFSRRYTISDTLNIYRYTELNIEY